MFSAPVNTMIARHNYPVVDAAGLDSLVRSHEEVVLFFAENAEVFPETDDVAMILPELVHAFGGRFQAAVVAASDQRKLQRRYGFKQWPTLVFLRRGEYLGAISRVQDWRVYLDRVQGILASAPSAPPEYVLPTHPAACHAPGGE